MDKDVEVKMIRVLEDGFKKLESKFDRLNDNFEDMKRIEARRRIEKYANEGLPSFGVPDEELSTLQLSWRWFNGEIEDDDDAHNTRYVIEFLERMVSDWERKFFDAEDIEHDFYDYFVGFQKDGDMFYVKDVYPKIYKMFEAVEKAHKIKNDV